MPKICLNMIVRNEAARITRALDSVAQFIDCWVITDTGSTDDTPKVIEEYCAQYKIPGLLHHAPFHDWSQARNAALITARSMQRRFGWDWALMMDADMVLQMKNFPDFEKTLDEAHAKGVLALDMEQRGGTIHYANRRLVSSKATGLYRGVTHEYLDVETGGLVPSATAYFDDHADGANRPEKYKRDIRLLLEGLQKEPDNGRYFYYLAQSYRDAGDLENAKLWYRKRVEFGGWEEERWSAQMGLAHCYMDAGDEDGFIREMLAAYNMRPTRAESLFDLANYFRHKDGKQAIAAMFAEVGMGVPKPDDLLFVNDFAYRTGLKEEFAITGFYNPTKKAKAFQVCSALSLEPGPYASGRHSARHNLFWYMPTLGEVCPSFSWKRIPFEPPADWVAMNPSVTNHGVDDHLYCNVRCVNYKIDENGAYFVRGTGDAIGYADAEHPICTRNFLLDMCFDPMIQTLPPAAELLPPSNLPCEFKPVRGLEDSRLFSAEGKLWTSSTVRQIHWDGNCEQVVIPIERRMGGTFYGAWKRMLPAHRETEKNWAPIGVRPDDHRELLFMHRPGVTINDAGMIVHNNPPSLTTDIISGGSQLVGFAMGYLALVHTAQQKPGSSRRYYYHRFAVYDPAFNLISLSLPFVFNEKTIEFAAGLARHPTQKGVFVISYGFDDKEARIATITEADIARFLWAQSK